jgi:hypothetical protein
MQKLRREGQRQLCLHCLAHGPFTCLRHNESPFLAAVAGREKVK